MNAVIVCSNGGEEAGGGGDGDSVKDRNCGAGEYRSIIPTGGWGCCGVGC